MRACSGCGLGPTGGGYGLHGRRHHDATDAHACSCCAGKLPLGGAEAQAGAATAGGLVRAGSGMVHGAARMLDMFGCSINYNRKS